MNFSKLASDENRWWALVVLALGLAIVIIDNTVLNVAIPYILRDLHASLDGIQWVISGYALIIATLLITVGRISDIFGRKRIFLLGTIFFAIGSFVASISHTVGTLFLGESFIEAIGAAMMLTTSLSLLTTEFQGRERAIAFGVWGSVAGASASIGPILGGYFTTYHSWRWSLRINVLIALVAIIGSVFIKESKGEGEKKFDWQGTFLSGLGLFSLVFGFIEGQKYGWWHPAAPFILGNWQWFSDRLSIVAVAFALAAVFLTFFVITEYEIEKKGGTPLLRMSMFKNPGFGTGLVTLGIISLGQFGVFFVLPIFLQNVLGLDALHTGYVFLPMSLAVLVVGPLSGYIASKIKPARVVEAGMIISCIGTFWVMQSISAHATIWSLAPALIVFGMGVGATGAQLTNIILSSVPQSVAGEASAVNSAMRQVGTSIGIAVIGVVLASVLTAKIPKYINADNSIPAAAKNQIIQNLNVAAGAGVSGTQPANANPEISQAIKADVNQAMTDASRRSFETALLFILAGTIFALFIPGVSLSNAAPHKE